MDCLASEHGLCTWDTAEDSCSCAFSNLAKVVLASFWLVSLTLLSKMIEPVQALMKKDKRLLFHDAHTEAFELHMEDSEVHALHYSCV